MKTMDPKVEPKSNSIAVLLDEAIFPRAVGLAAAYRFLDRCYVLLETRPKGHLHVRLKGKEALNESSLRALAGEFGNELVHQLVRHQVSERTDQLRATIVGRALLSADPSLSSDALDPGTPEQPLDYQDDPLGIAVPWEEKYGDRKKRAKKG